MILYLDQGEELYTRAAAEQASRFSRLLADGLSDPRLLAFASLRADYFDRLQADEPLFGRYEHINVPPLDRARLHEVVTEPARALDVRFEHEAVAERITDAAAAQPGALPLLSYQLTDMWTAMVQRDDASLRLAAESIDLGGVLASRAEQFLGANPSDEPALRRLVTLRLAHVPAVGEPVRRQSSSDEASGTEWALAGRLSDHPWRLVVTHERPSDNRVVAEVAHEALLRAWPRLSGWLRDERDFLVFKGEAEHAERRWRELGAPDRALLTGLDLARAEEWLPTRAEDLSPGVRAYVQKSIAVDWAAKQKQLRFQRRVTFGAVAAALIMLVVGGFAWDRWRAAVLAESRVEAELGKTQVTQSRFLADLAREQRAAGDTGTALLLALAALPDFASATLRPYVPDAEARLDAAARSLRERMHDTFVLTAAFSPDGRRIVTASNDKTARLWNAETGKPIGEPLTGHDGPVSSAAFSSDGQRILTAGVDNARRTPMLQTRRLLYTNNRRKPRKMGGCDMTWRSLGDFTDQAKSMTCPEVGQQIVP